MKLARPLALTFVSLFVANMAALQLSAFGLIAAHPFGLIMMALFSLVTALFIADKAIK